MLNLPRAVGLIVAVAALAASAAVADRLPPEGISPGSPTAVLTASGSCPTFSWAADLGEGFELTVLNVSQGSTAAPPDSAPRAAAADDGTLLISLPAGALSWTPAPEQCLQPGAVYGWAVRSVTAGAAGAWSRPLLFRVSLAPTAEEVARAVDILTAPDAPSSPVVARSPLTRPVGPAEPVLSEAEGAHGTTALTPAVNATAELEGDAGMSVDGIVEVHGLLSQSANAGGSDNIVADGQISTPFNIIEVPLLYLNSGGVLSTATWLHSPAPGELEIGRGTGSEADADIGVDLLFVNSLSTDVLKSGTSLGWIGGGGVGVNSVPLNGSNQIRLDSAGDACPAGSVATGIRLKVVDTNQAGVELECSD